MTQHFHLEARLLLRNRLFLIMAATVVGLCGFCGFQGGELARQQASAIEAAMKLERGHDAQAVEKAAQIKSGEITPPWWRSPLNAQGWSYLMIRHAALPPRPLAGVAIGDADTQPFLFRINPHPPDRWSNRASELTPSVAAYGGLDLTDVLLILTPLLIIVAFADVIRDRGGSERQRLATVQATDEKRLTVARLLPRAALALGLILAASSIGLIATAPSFDSETVAGGVLIVLTFLLHGLFWTAFAAALTLLVRSSVVNFALFISTWFVLGVLAPSIVESATKRVAPPPSPLKVFASERAAVVRARMDEDALTRNYAAQDPLASEMLLEALENDTLLITPTNLLIQRAVDDARKGARRQEKRAHENYHRQAHRLSSLWPSLLARNTIYKLAGRDRARRSAFNAQVDAYHADLQRVFVPLLMRRATLDDVLLPKPFVFDETPE